MLPIAAKFASTFGTDFTNVGHDACEILLWHAQFTVDVDDEPPRIDTAENARFIDLTEPVEGSFFGASKDLTTHEEGKQPTEETVTQPSDRLCWTDAVLDAIVVAHEAKYQRRQAEHRQAVVDERALLRKRVGIELWTSTNSTKEKAHRAVEGVTKVGGLAAAGLNPPAFEEPASMFFPITGTDMYDFIAIALSVSSAHF